MIPYNVLASIPLPFITYSKLTKDVKELPYKVNMMQEAEDNQLDIRRSILNLHTISNFRAAFIFEQQEESVTCTRFEPFRHPLSTIEARGMLTLTMQELKQAPECLKKIRGDRTECIKRPKKVIQYLKGVDPATPIFILLVFENFLFATGTFYNETTLCQALVTFCPREDGHVISNMRTGEDGLPFYLKRVNPSFSVEVPQLQDWEEIVL